jgi:hypothetical protein
VCLLYKAITNKQSRYEVNEDSGNTICGAQTILFLDTARNVTAAVRMIMMSVFKSVSSIIDVELKTKVKQSYT